MKMGGRLHLLYRFILFFLIGKMWGGVQLGPLSTAATNRPIVPGPDDYDDREFGGIIGRGNRSTRRKPALVPLCLPQTPHSARKRTRAAAVGSNSNLEIHCLWVHFTHFRKRRRKGGTEKVFSN
jgi:hypothetical protein